MSRLTAELLANLPTSSREAKLGQVATETLSSSQARHGARQQGNGAVPSDTHDNTPLNTQQNTPQTPPRIKPMTKTPPINNSGTLGYVDDILCYSMTLEDHINLLHILFHRIKEANCRLKTSKCFIARKEVQYLGYMVGEEGWGMCPEYRKSVTSWPIPTTKKELGSFLGRAGYYRGFLQHYSDLTADLNKAKTREQAPWSLTPDEIAQFHKLQQAFNSSESLSFPNYDDLKLNPLIMDLDFSKKGLSASISQNQECKDSVFRERLLCNVSRKAPSELAVSSSHRGEISACVLGLSSFRHLLLLAPFKIRSDSISVRYLSTLKDQRAPFPRYFQLLADFTFTAEHRPGKTNIPDDSVSRRDDLPEMTREEKDFHSSRSFVDQITVAQLEELEDIAIEFADPFPT